MPRRMGRPGLMGTVARTAVIAGTATAVSGSMQHKQQQKAAQQQAATAQQQAAAAQQQQALVDQAASQAAAQAAAQVQAQQAAAAPTATSTSDDPVAKIRELGELKAQGLLTDEEFSAAKAQILGTA